MKLSTAKYSQPNHLVALVLLSIIGMSVTQAAPPPLSIKSAVYNKKTASLIVQTHIKDPGGLLTLLHSKGGVLGQSQENEHTFTIPLTELGEIPCQVEARLGELKISKAVAGAGAECSKVPVCKILKPVSNLKTTINQPTHFEAQYTLKDKKAGPLAIEWDFAGGVMGHPYQKPLKGNKPILSGKHKTDVTFVRDNSRYHVRFMATDTQGRHCESGIYVDVGTPPTDLPDAAALDAMVQASQTNAPAKGSALKIPAGEKVILPYQDWTMQTATDARTVPNVYVVYGPQVNNINATVYEKARKPPVIGVDKVELKYSAAANPADPVGPNSINSTSQNWPVDTRLMEASVQKSDYFETYTRPADVVLADGYYSYSFTGFLSPELVTEADEGYHNPALFPPINFDHGRYMPGKTEPYVDNIPQSFSDYVEADNLFAARMLPLTDIDDSGRVNTAPLFRIEARDLENDTTMAITDIAVSAERDFHCRECHAKGKMGTKADRSQALYRAFNYVEADSDSIFDQEYAAVWNTASLHSSLERESPRMNTVKSHPDNDYVALNDGPAGCSDAGTCHTTVLSITPFGKPLVRSPGGDLARSMHWYHASLQYNAKKDDVVRVDNPGFKGRAVRFNPENNWDSKTGSMTNGLFPVKDKDGNILPMEENCLKCHSGKREQCYRDRMYTAGVTCYQCHGDMMALSIYQKSIPGPDGRVYRQPWVDEPDCGSCHTGNANQGKNGNADFFSGGVRRLAFNAADRSATPRQPDPLNPDEIRFAVPIASLTLGNIETLPDGSEQPMITKAPLYRAGKDNHGQVACGACHGAAHAIWPNRDPNANDNVTSLQLQGHSGPIAECSVCHTDDAFAKYEDIDEGIKAANQMDGILGGPHNMHPINDPNWWRSADADITPNEISGKTNGGWHNDYAKVPGRLDEDQCAACHGNDHLGTRLSKTPVDREFVNAKGKTIKVKAGTAIGCNLCHSVIISCKNSPSLNCGKPSEQVTKSANQAPVITSSADTVVVLGKQYRHQIKATDPEGEALSYQLKEQSSDLSIDENTGVVTIPASVIETLSTSVTTHYFDDSGLPRIYLYSYTVVVRDSQGAQTTQSVRLAFKCPTGLIWDEGKNTAHGHTPSCAKITIASSSPINGLNGGEPYLYTVVARQSSGKPLLYSLSGQPTGMTIVPNTGMINWQTPNNLTSPISFSVIVSNDKGDSVHQQVTFAVCSAPQHWDQLVSNCIGGPLSFTSDPSIFGIVAGEVYTYPVTATHADNLPLSYSLINSPDGMSIDASSGLINWVAQTDVSGYVEFTVNASDGQGGAAHQTWMIMVCAAPTHWSPDHGQCKGPIEFTSTPVYGLDEGQNFSYQVTATHDKGLPLTYSLGDIDPSIPRPVGMSIDAKTGLVSWIAQAQPIETTGGYAWFSVIATDSNGYSEPQTLQVLVCAAPSNWSDLLGGCRGAVRIISAQSVYGVDVGQTFTYQVVATEANPDGLPLSYSFSWIQPDSTGLSIDANTGLINWVATEDPNNPGVETQIQFAITATDTLGQQESQNGYVSVCVAPLHWSPDNQVCQ